MAAIPLPNLNLNTTKTATAGPAVSGMDGLSNMFNGGVWNVNYNGTQSNTSSAGQSLDQPGAAGLSMGMIAAAVGGVLLLLVLKRKKK